MTNKNYTRFSLNKKPLKTPTLFLSIVNYKNSFDNLFNISNKYISKNTNNSKLIVQKRDAKIYITRILREVAKTSKTLVNLVNDLRPEFSFGSVINSLSSSRFISYTQPTTYSGKKRQKRTVVIIYGLH